MPTAPTHGRTRCSRRRAVGRHRRCARRNGRRSADLRRARRAASASALAGEPLDRAVLRRRRACRSRWRDWRRRAACCRRTRPSTCPTRTGCARRRRSSRRSGSPTALDRSLVVRPRRSRRDQSRARSRARVRHGIASDDPALPPLARARIARRRNGARLRMRIRDSGDRRLPSGRRPRRRHGHRSAGACREPRQRAAQRRRSGVRPGRETSGEPAPFDVVVANILANPLISLAPALARRVRQRRTHRAVGHSRCAGRRRHQRLRAVV